MAKDNNTLLTEILAAIQAGGGGGGGGVAVSFSIPVTAWQEEAEATLGTSYKATVVVTCTENSAVLIYFAADSFRNASDSELIANVTGTNTVTFYAVSKPTATINGYLKIVATIS